MRVKIRYTCPVEVVVDLDSGKVDRVVLVNDGIEPDPDGPVASVGESHPVSREVAAQAFEIAEGAEWPSWGIA